MTVREKKNKLDRRIAKATDEIIRLQLACEHKSTTLKQYSYRIGCAEEAYICDDCDQFIGFKESYIINEITITTTDE